MRCCVCLSISPACMIGRLANSRRPGPVGKWGVIATTNLQTTGSFPSTSKLYAHNFSIVGCSSSGAFYYFKLIRGWLLCRTDVVFLLCGHPHLVLPALSIERKHLWTGSFCFALIVDHMQFLLFYFVVSESATLWTNFSQSSSITRSFWITQTKWIITELIPS